MHMLDGVICQPFLSIGATVLIQTYRLYIIMVFADGISIPVSMIVEDNKILNFF